MKYILVDTANTFFRARHIIRGNLNEKIGMALHVTFNRIRKAWNEHGIIKKTKKEENLNRHMEYKL